MIIIMISSTPNIMYKVHTKHYYKEVHYIWSSLCASLLICSHHMERSQTQTLCFCSLLHANEPSKWTHSMWACNGNEQDFTNLYWHDEPNST